MNQNKVKSSYKGSKKTYSMALEQIKARFGAEEAKNYDPYQNCLTFNQWRKAGYRVKRGSKAIKTITYVEVKDETGNVVRTYPKTVCLFYYLDTESA